MPIGVPLTRWLLVLLRINGISVSWRKTQCSKFPASGSLHKGWTVSLSEQLSSTPICLFCSKSHYLARPKLFSLICCICEKLPFGCSPNILAAFSLSSLIPSGRNKYKFTPTHWRGIAQEQLLGHQMQAGGREWEHSQPPPSVLPPFPTHPAKCSLVSSAGGSHPCLQVCSGNFPPEINELWKDSQVLGNAELPRTTLAKAKSQDRKPLAETGGGHELSTCVQAGLPAADVQWGQSSSSFRVRSPQPQPRGSA